MHYSACSVDRPFVFTSRPMLLSKCSVPIADGHSPSLASLASSRPLIVSRRVELDSSRQGCVRPTQMRMMPRGVLQKLTHPESPCLRLADDKAAVKCNAFSWPTERQRRCHRSQRRDRVDPLRGVHRLPRSIALNALRSRVHFRSGPRCCRRLRDVGC